MLFKTVRILPTIYTLEVVTHSNNHLLKSFCLACLAKSKTNKQYKEYLEHCNVSSTKICAGCGAMSIQAVYAAWNIPRNQIIKMVEKDIVYRDEITGELIKFVISSHYLDMLKGIEHYGKE